MIYYYINNKQNIKINGGIIMKFKEFMEMYDNWNGTTRVNDYNLNTIVEDRTVDIMDTRKDLFDKEVIAFRFYNNIFCVRVR